jgi:DNA-binding HxlR family transcriptional regulator
MKNIISNLNKAFENRVRLGIMSILMVSNDVDFNTIKETLNLTDGNLASHLKALENIKYIFMNKQFVGRKPRTSYSATESGKMAFKSHLNALEKLIRGD